MRAQVAQEQYLVVVNMTLGEREDKPSVAGPCFVKVSLAGRKQ